MKTQSDSKLFEIRLKDHIGENTLIWFEDFSVEYGTDGETILFGPIIDQAALHGLLTQICNLGLTLTFFRQMGDGDI